MADDREIAGRDFDCLFDEKQAKLSSDDFKVWLCAAYGYMTSYIKQRATMEDIARIVTNLGDYIKGKGE